MWDCQGIETVVDITPYEHEDDDRLLEMIATGKPAASHFGQLLYKFLMRARFNSHRFYEIYAIATVDDITQEDIYKMFTENPQTSAELIRKSGVKIYSDRPEQKANVIS